MSDKTEKTDNWLGSWLNAAKNKSTEVLEFVKKDLEEFGSVVKNEANCVISSTGSVLENTLSLDSPTSTASTMKRSFSSFLGQMNSVLNPSPDDSDTEILIVENSETVELTKLQKAIYDLQKNADTFLKDPDESLSKQFRCWLEIVDDQLSDDRIAKYVNSSEILKRQYAKLVPEVVEHHLFWKRYLFKKALLEDEFARQEALEKREQKEKLMSEDDLKWEQEDFAADIELSEEQQIKLLEEYEKEKKNESSPKNRKLIGENVVFKQDSRKKETCSSRRQSEEKLQKNNSTASVGTPSSNSSTDGDWEKISDSEKELK
ncbi:unnamed protein product [Acanthoscelides obtectus]|uniref:BSD domain-containing protein n=1 Tax=Acanthoscelides obtectus TaxID=200917 RepID=A0A9P0K728_ACAOB|nr:unnamed protein product [Acanthoscelides obtectus]CAK1658657.1 BSD domain-containing protein 1 [Acanthoscelides obtectus]